MKLGELEEHFKEELSQQYDGDEARAMFSLAAEHVLKFSPGKLRMMGDSVMDFVHLQKMLSILNDLIIGKPIQYILGETHFYGLVFIVNENVLIPRPETEELVDWIISDLKLKPTDSIKIFDIGTGSGCIPITLKKHLSEASVSSLDVSTDALEVAQKNAVQLNTPLSFIHADILKYSSEEKYDVIVSNPPYIRDLEKAGMHANVLDYEPQLALFVDDNNPLIFYNAIADFAKTNLKPTGNLYLEINEFLSSETIEMLSAKGFTSIDLRKDMQFKNRMIKASFDQATTISDETV
ncbi:peptide chain release factor N(5)-glutamine methyltransferase [Pedobacter sp. MC2016-05]|uniref:peptide chain release factor N(5)-glutamine methyltransferase n=1 Tax=Pedobacter sp. MC2016-05 TaxID=2994474 RepID=UPI002247DA69|nr:peptide chain release factor N(5)-glutamine methyltransferase [Pedobacter sp. MC2016-05]MCX2474588.1 peptide chain release factor N(5)-glutamine methyltransferase [Pedobacter sp. MC2016-05]